MSPGVTFAVCAAVVVSICGCETATRAEREAQKAALGSASKGEALFRQKCSSVAGEKIYRTVPDVEGTSYSSFDPTEVTGN